MNRQEQAAVRRMLVKEPHANDIDAWMAKTGGRFEEAYHWMRATTGFPPEACMVGAWMSMGKDDRGGLKTMTEVADWLCVARNSAYVWRTKYRLDEWAEQLRMIQLRGQALGEVDRVTYNQAVSDEAPIDARRLYYQRAGVLNQDITVHEASQKEQLSNWLAELRGLETTVIDVEAEEVPEGGEE